MYYLVLLSHLVPGTTIYLTKIKNFGNQNQKVGRANFEISAFHLLLNCDLKKYENMNFFF